MATPSTEFIAITMSDAATALDTSGERVAYSGDGAVDDSGSNNLDFGTVDITSGAADSDVKAVLWRVTDDGGNTEVSNFRLWLSSNGFDDAATVLKFATAKLDPTSEWVQNPTTASYSFSNLPESEPAQNVLAADGSGTSLALDGDNGPSNDTTEAMILYIAVGASETLGAYSGATSGFELRFTFKFDFS